MENTTVLHLLAVIGLYGGTYVVCLISGFIPIVNAELFLIWISLSISKPEFLPVLLLASTGQMTAKVVMYFSGKGVIKISKKRYEKKIAEIEAKMKKWESKIDIFIFLSAFTGFPPFYVVAVLSGMTNVNFVRFCIAGLLGRTLRFGLVMYFPQLFKELIS
jgi:membrane protein YqaA with SNARE-associated domain